MMNRKSGASDREGVVLVCVLVCLGLVAALMLTAIHVSLTTRRQMRRELQMEQTKWLLDAAVRDQLAEPGKDQPGKKEIVPPLRDGYVASIESVVSAGEEGKPSEVNVAVVVAKGEGSVGSTRRSVTLEIDSASDEQSSHTGSAQKQED